MAFLNFNAAAVQPATGGNYDPIPAGDYLAHITESDINPLSSGNGNGLNLTFEIVDGPHKGRKVWEKLSIVHANTKTQQIAQEQLSAICHAIGILQPQDSAELHYKPLTIHVTIRPPEGQYKAKNVIKGYKSATGAAPQAGHFAAPQGAAPMQHAAPMAAPSNRPAWAKAA